MNDYSIDSIINEATSKGLNAQELSQLTDNYTRVQKSYDRCLGRGAIAEVREAYSLRDEIAYNSTKNVMRRIIDEWHTKPKTNAQRLQEK